MGVQKMRNAKKARFLRESGLEKVSQREAVMNLCELLLHVPLVSHSHQKE